MWQWRAPSNQSPSISAEVDRGSKLDPLVMLALGVAFTALRRPCVEAESFEHIHVGFCSILAFARTPNLRHLMSHAWLCDPSQNIWPRDKRLLDEKQGGEEPFVKNK